MCVTSSDTLRERRTRLPFSAIENFIKTFRIFISTFPSLLIFFQNVSPSLVQITVDFFFKKIVYFSLELPCKCGSVKKLYCG